ncbi:MAG: 16S rRNA (cytidine(1402)-2'-O)-methyltransferase [Acidobacteriota bacterium]
MAGTLYVVATPIGNLEDLSPRAVRILKAVSVVACEDTRVTARLLSGYGIKAVSCSYHEHNERARAQQLVKRLAAGADVALVSDAGTPGISDPGYRLVRAARERHIPVRTVPGPSAPLAALAVSGLPTKSFTFFGFLPVGPAARREILEELAASPHTLILFETARRAPALLEALAERLGPRPAFVGREMTKLHEEHRSGTLPELARWARQNPLRGELTLVITGRGRRPKRGATPAAGREEQRGATTTESTPGLFRRFRQLTKVGLTRREAAKVLARETGLPSREVYRKLLRPAGS